ncbi:MAG TPA: SCO family protein [Gaiellaceae bacterium]|nr:SCO family protein [Gaiellaceae bacterium]
MRSKHIAFVLASGIGAGAGIGAAVYLARGSTTAVEPSRPAATWAANERRAPDFRLVDQNGQPVSLAALRGRPAILTFIDPVCRDLCPLEARVLARVHDDLGASAPSLVAVSVNPPADNPSNFAKDAAVWGLPASWRWATGAPAALARVWQAYHVGVQTARKTIAGVSVRTVAHTEAAYVIDADGFERALFIYPYVAADVERELGRLGA